MLVAMLVAMIKVEDKAGLIASANHRRHILLKSHEATKQGLIYSAEFPRQEFRTTCDSFKKGETQEHLCAVKVMEIRYGGAKLGPQALKSNLNTDRLIIKYGPYLRSHIRGESAANNPYSESRVWIIEENKKEKRSSLRNAKKDSRHEIMANFHN